MQPNDFDNNASTIQTIKKFLLDYQTKLCQQLELEENEQHKFHSDHWNYQHSGGGCSKILSGKTFEKAGVNFSHVKGQSLPQSATANRPELSGCPFEAMGVSIVIHPYSPMIPTSHANVRFIQVQQSPEKFTWWFGGGYDLTPYYGFVEDCQHWHQTAYHACKAFGDQVYQEFKTWCDDYFFIKHRNEARGIGGLFFDDLNRWPIETCFKFMQTIANSYIEAYIPIVKKRKMIPYDEEQKAYQLYRRGRYVEFNLVYDRGTLFGLQSGGRTESILMSLPPSVQWLYNWQPKVNSEEERLINYFLTKKDWLDNLK